MADRRTSRCCARAGAAVRAGGDLASSASMWTVREGRRRRSIRSIEAARPILTTTASEPSDGSAPLRSRFARGDGETAGAAAVQMASPWMSHALASRARLTSSASGLASIMEEHEQHAARNCAAGRTGSSPRGFRRQRANTPSYSMNVPMPSTPPQRAERAVHDRPHAVQRSVVDGAAPAHPAAAPPPPPAAVAAHAHARARDALLLGGQHAALADRQAARPAAPPRVPLARAAAAHRAPALARVGGGAVGAAHLVLLGGSRAPPPRERALRDDGAVARGGQRPARQDQRRSARGGARARDGGAIRRLRGADVACDGRAARAPARPPPPRRHRGAAAAPRRCARAVGGGDGARRRAAHHGRRGHAAAEPPARLGARARRRRRSEALAGDVGRREAQPPPPPPRHRYVEARGRGLRRRPLAHAARRGRRRPAQAARRLRYVGTRRGGARDAHRSVARAADRGAAGRGGDAPRRRPLGRPRPRRRRSQETRGEAAAKSVQRAAASGGARGDEQEQRRCHRRSLSRDAAAEAADGNRRCDADVGRRHAAARALRSCGSRRRPRGRGAAQAGLRAGAAAVAEAEGRPPGERAAAAPSDRVVAAVAAGARGAAVGGGRRRPPCRQNARTTWSPSCARRAHPPPFQGMGAGHGGVERASKGRMCSRNLERAGGAARAKRRRKRDAFAAFAEVQQEARRTTERRAIVAEACRRRSLNIGPRAGERGVASPGVDHAIGGRLGALVTWRGAAAVRIAANAKADAARNGLRRHRRRVAFNSWSGAAAARRRLANELVNSRRLGPTGARRRALTRWRMRWAHARARAARSAIARRRRGLADGMMAWRRAVAHRWLVRTPARSGAVAGVHQSTRRALWKWTVAVATGLTALMHARLAAHAKVHFAFFHLRAAAKSRRRTRALEAKTEELFLLNALAGTLLTWKSSPKRPMPRPPPSPTMRAMKRWTNERGARFRAANAAKEIERRRLVVGFHAWRVGAPAAAARRAQLLERLVLRRTEHGWRRAVAGVARHRYDVEIARRARLWCWLRAREAAWRAWRAVLEEAARRGAAACGSSARLQADASRLRLSIAWRSFVWRLAVATFARDPLGRRRGIRGSATTDLVRCWAKWSEEAHARLRRKRRGRVATALSFVAKEAAVRERMRRWSEVATEGAAERALIQVVVLDRHKKQTAAAFAAWEVSHRRIAERAFAESLHGASKDIASRRRAPWIGCLTRRAGEPSSRRAAGRFGCGGRGAPRSALCRSGPPTERRGGCRPPTPSTPSPSSERCACSSGSGSSGVRMPSRPPRGHRRHPPRRFGACVCAPRSVVAARALAAVGGDGDDARPAWPLPRRSRCVGSPLQSPHPDPEGGGTDGGAAFHAARCSRDPCVGPRHRHRAPSSLACRDCARVACAARHRTARQPLALRRHPPRARRHSRVARPRLQRGRSPPRPAAVAAPRGAEELPTAGHPPRATSRPRRPPRPPPLARHPPLRSRRHRRLLFRDKPHPRPCLPAMGSGGDGGRSAATPRHGVARRAGARCAARLAGQERCEVRAGPTRAAAAGCGPERTAVHAAAADASGYRLRRHAVGGSLIIPAASSPLQPLAVC